MEESNKLMKDLYLLFNKTIRKYDYVERLYGSSFGLILKNCGKDEIIVVAKRLSEAVEMKNIKMPNDEAITISIGGSILEDFQGLNPENIIERAENAMIDSKSIKKISLPISILKRRQNAQKSKPYKSRIDD